MRDEEREKMLERDHRVLLVMLVFMTIALVAQSVWGC